VAIQFVMRPNIGSLCELCQDVSMSPKRALQQPSTPEEGLADALVTSAFITMAVINKIGAEHDLSLSLVRVLGILVDRRPRMTELADYLGLEKHTMSGLIDRAEKKGLVARAPNETDGRATDVLITAEGLKLIKRLRAQGQKALAPLIAQLSAAEQSSLQNLLQRMLQSRAN
jgi:DNA-binding MarR family transcriptional regulator